jgi:hypothetical protein
MGRSVRIAVVFVIGAVPCAAQSAASLAINAGTGTDVTGTASNALTIAPSLTRTAGRVTSSLSGSGTHFGNGAWAAGIATAFRARAADRAITPVLDVGGSGAVTSYELSYGSIDLLPSLETRIGAVRIFGGAHLGASGTSALAATSPSLGPLTPAGSRTTTSNSLRTLVAGGSVSTTDVRGHLATLGYRGETGRVAGLAQTDHELTASLSGSRLSAGTSVGQRTSATQSATYGAATMAVGVTPLVAVRLSAGSYPADRRIGTAAGKFVNAGLVMRFTRNTAMPMPTRVASPARGMTRLAIRATDARSVEIAGDFNKWQAKGTTRADNGVWYIDLALPPGEYRYAFRIDGKEWRVPEGVAAADDEFGGKSAWLVVRQNIREEKP